MNGAVPATGAAPAPAGYPLRRLLVVALLVASTAGLVWRAAYLQVTHRDFLQSQGAARYLRTVPVPAHRGKILDRNAEPLAISTPVESVWAVPAELARARARWPELAAALGVDETRIARRVAGRGARAFVYLRRHVEPARARAVESLSVSGVHLRREYRRYYPQGESAAHVVGFTNVDDVGQEGVELAFDEHLRGRPGLKRVLRDRLGRVVEDIEQIRAPRPGRDLTLSIDARLQYLAYRALLGAVDRHRARGGSAVVLDAVTGEVLAMVNQPSYNPNKRGDRVSARYRNRAVTDVFEPGSTIKPFTIAAALETGRFRPDTRIDTRPGLLRVGRHTVRDIRDYGEIDLATVIKKSSNVGAARVALSLEPQELWTMFSRVGFGATTASGFPGEAEGVLGHYLDWGEVERATLSFGYGVSVTALQLAQAYAVIASGGLMPPVTFRRVEAPAQRVRVMSAETARHLRWMLEAVVGPGGTGRRAAVAGYRVGGKTGTARKSTAGGYAEDRYLALFAGMAPLSEPRVVAVVVVDEPSGDAYYGGQVAAPVFSRIVAAAMRILGVAPDDGAVVARRVSLGRRAGTLAAAGVGRAPAGPGPGPIGEVVR